MYTYDYWFEERKAGELKAYNSYEARLSAAHKIQVNSRPDLVITDILPYIAVKRRRLKRGILSRPKLL